MTEATRDDWRQIQYIGREKIAKNMQNGEKREMEARDQVSRDDNTKSRELKSIKLCTIQLNIIT